MTCRNHTSIYLFLLLLTFQLSKAQQTLPSIACICELEALIIQSKEIDKELILEETADGFTYEFVPKEIEVPKQELKLVNVEKEEEINTEEPLEIKKEQSKRVLKKRKVKSRKRRKDKRVKLKKKKFKKYKGNCPRW